MATTSTEPGAAPALGLLSRFIGVITSPKATFQSVVAHPRWLGMLVLVCLTLAVLVGGFMLSKVGQDAWLDTVLNSPRGQQASDQQLETFRRIAPFVGYIAIGWTVVFLPILYVVVAGILFGVFNVGLGGNATFKQVFAVVVHTAPIGVLQQVFTVPMNYARGAMASATNLAVLFPEAENTFLGRLAGAIDFFLIWQLVVLAIGLAVLYRRRTGPIATTLFVIYGVIALAIAAVMSTFGGTN